MKTGLNWIRNHRTTCAVLIATIAAGLLVGSGRMPVDRAFVMLAICWATAFNSETINDHRQQTIQALELAAKAGVEFRAGQLGACEQDALKAGEVIVGEVRELRAEQQGESHG